MMLGNNINVKSWFDIGERIDHDCQAAFVRSILYSMQVERDAIVNRLNAGVNLETKYMMLSHVGVIDWAMKASQVIWEAVHNNCNHSKNLAIKNNTQGC